MPLFVHPGTHPLPRRQWENLPWLTFCSLLRSRAPSCRPDPRRGFHPQDNCDMPISSPPLPLQLQLQHYGEDICFLTSLSDLFLLSSSEGEWGNALCCGILYWYFASMSSANMPNPQFSLSHLGSPDSGPLAGTCLGPDWLIPCVSLSSQFRPGSRLFSVGYPLFSGDFFLWAPCSAHELEAGSEKTVKLSNATCTWLRCVLDTLLVQYGWDSTVLGTRHMILPTCIQLQTSNHRLSLAAAANHACHFLSLACIEPPSHTPFI
ncbi:hypothetical protein V8C42DRAFT_296657 [Trichoderma barbatum]